MAVSAGKREDYMQGGTQKLALKMEMRVRFFATAVAYPSSDAPKSANFLPDVNWKPPR